MLVSATFHGGDLRPSRVSHDRDSFWISVRSARSIDRVEVEGTAADVGLTQPEWREQVRGSFVVERAGRKGVAAGLGAVPGSTSSACAVCKEVRSACWKQRLVLYAERSGSTSRDEQDQLERDDVHVVPRWPAAGPARGQCANSCCWSCRSLSRVSGGLSGPVPEVWCRSVAREPCRVHAPGPDGTRLGVPARRLRKFQEVQPYGGSQATSLAYARQEAAHALEAPHAGAHELRALRRSRGSRTASVFELWILQGRRDRSRRAKHSARTTLMTPVPRIGIDAMGGDFGPNSGGRGRRARAPRVARPLPPDVGGRRGRDPRGAEACPGGRHRSVDVVHAVREGGHGREARSWPRARPAPRSAC